ncbi:MAG: ParB/RepB/Spo0J family partition protein [Stagnimonas sp.]|nr:ParB/RepB/Spo0J family partition protein [Stagnimonas sp.]
MSVKKRGLGRGLDALLGTMNTSGVAVAPEQSSDDALHELPLLQLAPGKHQPRRHFDEGALSELTESIRAQGVVQPIVVRPLGGDRYEIVAGERRWRAAQRAGLSSIPVVVRELDERAAMAIALVENIQRADLNALEEAEALHRLIQECGLTHEACAEAVGKSRAAVSNLLRLMELEAEVQALLRAGNLSFGHAKVLLGISGARQSQLAKQVVERQLSVRQTEALVHGEPVAASKKPAPVAAPLESELARKWGAGVKLQQNAQGRGKLTIAFKSATELERLLAALR